MARARNIKPSIMGNEDLAALPALTRVLFVYMWMLADKEGRIEDRPKRIAAQALPYDRDADVDDMLNELQKAGFITRYTVGSKACIQVVNFVKHQTPHVREAASTLPGLSLDTTKEVQEHNLGSASTSPRSPDSLIPSSLIPDSLIPPSSVPDGTGDESPPAAEAEQREEKPMTAKERVWTFGPTLVGGADDGARAFVGRLLKAAGSEEIVAEVLDACAVEKPGAPRPWLMAACRERAARATKQPVGIDLDSDPKPAWATGAGFANRFEAENAGCWPRNASEFRDGRRAA